MMLIYVKTLITFLFIGMTIRWYYKDEEYEHIPTVFAWIWSACVCLGLINFIIIIWSWE
jgi:hypothetical protein